MATGLITGEQPDRFTVRAQAVYGHELPGRVAVRGAFSLFD